MIIFHYPNVVQLVGLLFVLIVLLPKVRNQLQYQDQQMLSAYVGEQDNVSVFQSLILLNDFEVFLFLSSGSHRDAKRVS